MNQDTIRELLTTVQEGKCSIEEGLQRLQHMPGQFIRDACIDHHRNLRTGKPEVIYGESKTATQIVDIAKTFLDQDTLFLATRIDAEKGSEVREQLPGLHYHERARILSCNGQDPQAEKVRGDIVILCAGTSDIPVAEEARVTAEMLGNPVVSYYDAGVAGLHRLFHKQELITSAAVIIVVAGMEGALPSVVGGMCSCPVIGVPTSVGYGTSFAGITALLGMLNSCAPGLVVVNIDNGFGAACHAHTINRKNSSHTLQDSGSGV